MTKNKTIKALLLIAILLAGAWYTGLIPLTRAQAQQGVLTATVTSGPLTARNASLHLELTDDGVVVISRNFSESYTQSIGLTMEVRDSIRKKMQEAIDAYRILEATKAKPGYGNAPGIVEGQLDLTKEL